MVLVENRSDALGGNVIQADFEASEHLVQQSLAQVDRLRAALQLERVLGLLALEPRELMRTSETAYREAGLDDPTLDRQALVAAMVANPILIQRPVAISGDRAALGRPPERVLDLLPA